MAHRVWQLLVAIVLLASAGCGRSDGDSRQEAAAPPQPLAWAATVQPLALPAASGSSAPQLTASSRGVILSWIEQEGPTATLKFAERTAAGWSEVRNVASGDDWFLSAADAPSVMRMSDGTIVANWYQTTRIELEAYNLWLSYSGDDGKTWARPFLPHHDGTTTQHGFASLFEMPGKGLGLAWLDAREWELNQDAPDGGAVMLRFASFDAGWKQTADETVNLRVCDCCQTSVAVTSDGPIVAFRDRSDREIRDIAVTRLENGVWSEATPVHGDGWEIDSCPVNGPAIAASGTSTAAAWFVAKDQPSAYLSFSGDAGRTWGAPIRLDDAASRGQVDVEMLADGSAAATWIEFAEGRSRFKIRRVAPSGAKSPAIEIAGSGGGRISGYPHVVRAGNELILTWAESMGSEENAPVSQVKAAVLRLP